MGSYYYDKHLSPIPLYGQEDKDGNLSLCEVHNEKEYDAVVMHGFKNGFDSSSCPLKFTPTSDGAVGQWSDARHTYAVALQNVGSFDDTKTSEISGTMEIPFWGQTQRHAFIGVYALSKAEDMVDVRVQVIDKKTGAVIQMIDPDCSFGFYMTPIYMNIERGNSGSEGVYFNCAGARDSELLYYSIQQEDRKVSAGSRGAISGPVPQPGLSAATREIRDMRPPDSAALNPGYLLAVVSVCTG